MTKKITPQYSADADKVSAVHDTKRIDVSWDEERKCFRVVCSSYAKIQPSAANAFYVFVEKF